MEKKTKVLVYLPRKLYIEVHERQLTNHVSYLVSRLLEEFLKATDVRISWTEMENKAEQREYLERKLREFLSQRDLPAEPPKTPVQEGMEPISSQENGLEKPVPLADKPEPSKEEPQS